MVELHESAAMYWNMTELDMAEDAVGLPGVDGKTLPASIPGLLLSNRFLWQELCEKFVSKIRTCASDRLLVEEYISHQRVIWTVLSSRAKIPVESQGALGRVDCHDICRYGDLSIKHVIDNKWY